jgi:cytochrome c oxidase cbb3-type subunit 1
MWVSDIMQGLMWRAYDELGFLQYSFVETVAAMHPYYVIRALGGALLMAYNVWRTVTSAALAEGEEALRVPAPAAAPAPALVAAAPAG